MAAFAPAAVQDGSADRVLGAEPVIEAEQVVGNLGGDASAPVRGLAALLADLGERRVAAGADLFALAGERGLFPATEVRRRLTSSRRSITSSTTSSRSD